MAPTPKKQGTPKTAPVAPKGADAANEVDDPTKETPAPAADASLAGADPQASVACGQEQQAGEDQPDTGPETATSNIYPAATTVIQSAVVGERKRTAPPVVKPGYVARISIKHNGRQYEPGDPIDLDHKSAQELHAIKAVAPVEDETD